MPTAANGGTDQHRAADEPWPDDVDESRDVYGVMTHTADDAELNSQDANDDAVVDDPQEVCGPIQYYLFLCCSTLVPHCWW